MIAMEFREKLSDGQTYTFRLIGPRQLMTLTNWLNKYEGEKLTKLRAVDEVMNAAILTVPGLIETCRVALEYHHPDLTTEDVWELVQDCRLLKSIADRVWEMPAGDDDGASAEGNAPQPIETSSS